VLESTRVLYTLQLNTEIMSGSRLVVDSALRAAVSLGSSKIPSELAKSSAALFSAYGGAKQTLPDLSYGYGELERKCFDADWSLFVCLFLLLGLEDCV